MPKEPDYVLSTALMETLSIRAVTLDKMLFDVPRIRVGDDTAYEFDAVVEALGIDR